MRREEEGELRREALDVEATSDGRVDVRDRVGEGEGELLHRVGSGLADVIAADRDRVPARQLIGGVGDEIGREAHRRTRREDVRAARDVFLEDVVLRRSADSFGADPLPLPDRDVHGEQDRRRRVDGHRRRDLAERDAFEEPREILERADGHADLPDLARNARIVGVVSHLRREVEGDRQASLAVLEEVAVARVRLLGGTEPRVLAHGPKTPAVHRRLDPARVRRLAGQPRIRGVAVEERRKRCAVRRLEFSPLRDPFRRVRVGRALPFGAVAVLLSHVADGTRGYRH